MVPVVPTAVPKAVSRTQNKQAKILDVAAELFLERGYDAVSLDDILERVGGSKTTLYSYYGGKEGLFAAMVQRMAEEKVGPFLDLDPAQLDPKAGLNAIGRRFMTLVNNREGREFYRMMIAEAERFPALARTFYEASPAVILREVRRNLEYWQKQGLLREGNAEALAIQFTGMLLGTFSTQTLLGIAPTLTDRQIGEWVSKGVTLFLEGALRRG
jgi:AcrR family transcriptional regulator